MDSIHDTHDYGYDPDTVEDAPLYTPPPLPTGDAPPTVDTEYLPPVGKQTTPSCFVWASTYGLTTFMAAQAAGIGPTQPSQQASPDYTYVQVMLTNHVASNTCQGGKIVDCFKWLTAHDGTPTVATAPLTTGCNAAWSAYAAGGRTADAAFVPPAWSKISVVGQSGIQNVRNMIGRGIPLAYGTRLYTDFPTYEGAPVPYVGSGQILNKKGTDQPAGHVMMVIGYNDTIEAVLIQNSWGTCWGGGISGSGTGGGFVWMAYATFQSLAQGEAVFIGKPSDPLAFAVSRASPSRR